MNSGPSSRPRALTDRPSNPGFRPVGEGVEDRLNVSGLFMSTLLAVGGMLAGFFAIAWYFRPTLLELGKWFVETLGGVGVALGYLVPDALTIPIPADLVGGVALFGDMSFASVVAWASAGSLIGGSLGWAVGRFVVWRVAALRERMETDTRVVPFLKRRGPVVLALAAITPLPYSLACWAAGGTNMPFGTFLFVSLLRIPRVGVYLWLVSAGVVNSSLIAGAAT